MSGSKRSGFVAVAGRPNAGKSTLVNRIVGEHVAIVSPVAQTTRRVVRAVHNTDAAQIVFVDLPGSQKPVDRLTERMQSAVHSSLGDVDVVLLVIDGAEDAKGGVKAVVEMAFASGAPVIIALNKVDKTKPHQLMERIASVATLIGDREYAALVPVSATSGDGCDALVDELTAILPEGPQYFPDDEQTDMRDEERISEYVREAALQHLRDELPHALIASVEEIIEDTDGVPSIECIIWVERESHVGIVVGKGGSMLKQIGSESREVIEQMWGRHCRLNLRVKVRKTWRDDVTQLTRWGL